MRAKIIDLAAYRRIKRNVERDLRRQYAVELAALPEAEQQAYLADLADEAGRYALAYVRVARPRWADQS